LVSLLPFGSIVFLDYVCNGFSFDNAQTRITDFGYAAIPLALMGHLAFYWNKVKADFWKLMEIFMEQSREELRAQVLLIPIQQQLSTSIRDFSRVETLVHIKDITL